METILKLEADGTEHTGVEIDRFLASVAGYLGLSDDDVSRSLPRAKAKLTEYGLHEEVGRTTYWEAGVRRECNVYRITSAGLDELRTRGR